jgi:hypothetical protein
MLSKDDIKAIRQADYIVPFYSPDKYQHPDLDWGIRVGKRFEVDRVWNDGTTHPSSDAHTRTIAADPQHCYVESHGRQRDEVKSCVAVCNIYDFVVYPMCALKLLRVGDELGIKFVADNNNGYLKKADLHLDEVWLRIVRKGKVVAEYPLESTVCENNSARIVRYADSY